MITHKLKDGTVLDDITGHKVSRKDVPEAYELMERMNEKEKKDEKKDS